MPAYIGQPRDFDFLVGHWQVHNRRLRKRLVGSNDWYEFDATMQAHVLLDGCVSVDEIHFPSEGFGGCTVRTLDRESRQWSIYWINSRIGRLFPPVHGGFDGARGEFYGEDEDDGRPVKVRFIWRRGTDTTHWEQAFSFDGETWETNWVMDSRRITP
jgi:hypothetical protein